MHAIEFELETLEFVPAGDEVGLLRVGGLWFAPARRELGEIALLVQRDSERLELAPLPDLQGVAPLSSPTGEEWHGAFTLATDVAEDPRAEFALRTGPDGEVALPRPGEWERLLPVDEEPAEEPGPADTDVVADLVAQLDEVARLEEDADEATAPPPDVAERVPEPDPLPEPQGPELTPADELAGLRAELDLRGSELDALRAELTAERQRREAVEEELRVHASVEDDLRKALAMREAEMASAVQQAQRAREAERRRDLAAASERGDDAAGNRERPPKNFHLTVKPPRGGDGGDG